MPCAHLSWPHIKQIEKKSLFVILFCGICIILLVKGSSVALKSEEHLFWLWPFSLEKTKLRRRHWFAPSTFLMRSIPKNHSAVHINMPALHFSTGSGWCWILPRAGISAAWRKDLNRSGGECFILGNCYLSSPGFTLQGRCDVVLRAFHEFLFCMSLQCP